MSAQHTPGPWTLNKGNRKPIIGFDVKDGGPLLPIVPEVHGHSAAEAKRNARLISAAPDLLEACIAYMRDRTDAGCTADSAAVKRMRAAIAKATGSAS